MGKKESPWELFLFFIDGYDNKSLVDLGYLPQTITRYRKRFERAKELKRVRQSKPIAPPAAEPHILTIKEPDKRYSDEFAQEIKIEGGKA